MTPTSAQILLIGVIARAPRIIECASLVDADAHFMCLEILFFQKARVIGRYDGRL